MSTDKTTHYGLHLWAPEDQFMREEFNENSRKIDVAIRGAANAAANAASAAAGAHSAATAANNNASAASTAAQNAVTQALAAAKAESAQALADAKDYTNAALVPVGYNVAQLLLQNHYDGKYTGYKKAVFFDGFTGRDQVSALSDGMGVDTDQRFALLDAVGQQDVSYYYGTYTSYSLEKGYWIRAEWTAKGNGVLTRLNYYAGGHAQVRIVKNGTVVKELQASGMPATVSLSTPVKVGDVFTITISNVNSERFHVYIDASSRDGFGYLLTFSPSAATSGALTSTSYPVGGGGKALLWVRHSGGTVSAQLLSGGTWRSMTAQTGRDTVALTGEPCRETPFVLSGAIGSSVQVKLSVSTTAGQSVKVYDYGGVVI